ncbi:cytochrome ubiquinol oxidase subunit I [Rhizobium tubonense]|uniref:Cytochrome ubiquinol oxidase subunit I n=1 Tax=Rhizobium tubonense TaxID=484088 RepID=A0A2W4DVF9_9HYPH|nr:cytochrome ubiquinol oxidase subunit I [Rhizobium tubonense]PZM08006.1 cytochrome ubiquinol oxidase subunit I [Rhizobium tubonense]
MDPTALLLSRLQFAFTVSFHIIFPAFTVGLAAWLTFLEAVRLWTGRPLYRRLFDFWLKIFAIAFGLGVVTGVVMAFQFGTNWSELSIRSGPIQGPLLGYESFTAFALEGSFFGVMMFGRRRVSPAVYIFACAMVALGTSLSSFWIMVNNSWMQWPTGYDLSADGTFVPTDWSAIIFSPVVWVRFPHMILAAYVTTSFCVAATGAWYLLERRLHAEGVAMIRMGLGLAAVLVPTQLFFGHLTGDYVHDKQPVKFAAIEARWVNEKPASEVLFAIPDESGERNLFSISVPYLGSLIGSMSLTSEEVGLKSFPVDQRPPILIPFFAFRIMVACGLAMLALAWYGSWTTYKTELPQRRWLLWLIYLSFPLGFIATLTGWFTAEVGRQPWAVYGVLRTADAVTPSLTVKAVAISFFVFALIYSAIGIAGIAYVHRLLQVGPGLGPEEIGDGANPKRPLAIPGGSPGTPPTPAE